MFVETHPWIRAILYLSLSLLLWTVATYIVVTTRLIYQQGYQIIDLHRQLEALKAEQVTFHARSDGRIAELESVVYIQVPGIAKDARARVGVTQSWQRNAYGALEGRIAALERWRYTCRCGGGVTTSGFSDLFTRPIQDFAARAEK